jgi:hypothetical protein
VRVQIHSMTLILSSSQLARALSLTTLSLQPARLTLYDRYKRQAGTSQQMRHSETADA